MEDSEETVEEVVVLDELAVEEVAQKDSEGMADSLCSSIKRSRQVLSSLTSLLVLLVRMV